MDLVRKLLTLKVDVNTSLVQSRTALGSAASLVRACPPLMLLHYRQPPNTTAADVAELEQLLLKAGADQFAQDSIGSCWALTKVLVS